MKLSLGTYVRDYSVAGGAVSYDADAQAYFTANTAITSDADKNAINDFYLGLKSDNIYTKIKAMYLPIWGSASASKWNLVNPLDTDAAFRMSYSTGWTFTSGGALPNNTSAYAIPYLIVKTVCSDTSHSFGIYSRTNDTSGVRLYGCWRENGAASLFLQSNLTTANAVSGGIETIASYTPSSTLGLINVSRTANNSLKVYRNGSIIATNTTAQTYTLPNAGITFGGRYKDNDATIDFYDNHQFSFAYISNGLTDTEATNFYNRVQTLMTYFGINV